MQQDTRKGKTTPASENLFTVNEENPVKLSEKDVVLVHSSTKSFQLQMVFPFPFLRANDLRSSLLNIRDRSFLLSCT